VKHAITQRGRQFVSVSHPDPLARVIEGEWAVNVDIGPERI